MTTMVSTVNVIIVGANEMTTDAAIAKAVNQIKRQARGNL